MHYRTREEFKRKSDTFFQGIPDPIAKAEMERLYQAFKARLIVELDVSGESNEGFIYGYLEDRA